MAWQDYIEYVQKLYVATLGRPADPGGLRYWATLIDLGGGTDEAKINAIKGIINSSEASVLYDSNDALMQWVIYHAFGRFPEPSETDSWSQYAEEHSPEEAVFAILENISNVNDAIVLENRVESAMNFTRVLDPELDGIGPFNATYDGTADPEDLTDARAFLEDVDATTVKTEQEAFIYVQENIADSGDSIVGQPTPTQGETFVLTTGIDLIEGTNYDDTIIGDNSSLLQPTVQAGDQIKGGGGTDVLKLYGFTGAAAIIPDVNSVEVIEFVLGAPVTVSTVGVEDLETLRIRDVARLANTVNITVASGQMIELVNIGNAVTQTINLNVSGEKTVDVTVDGVVEKVTNTATTQTVADLRFIVPTAVTTLNVTASGNSSDITVVVATTGNAGLQAGDHLNIKGTADIIVNLAATGTAAANVVNNIFIDASENTGETTLRFGGETAPTNNINNYAPIQDSRLEGVDKIVMFATNTGVTLTLDLSQQTEGFDIVGSIGSDTIKDGAGSDTIDAGDGNDTIISGKGGDTLTGGKGTDIFVFTSFDQADTITDFSATDDDIRLDITKNFVGSKRLNPTGTTITTIKGTTIAAAANTKQTLVRVLTTGGSTLFAKFSLNSNKAVLLPSSVFFVAKNTAKLISAITAAANTTGGANNDFAIAFGRTTANNNLYMVFLRDTNTGTAGGAKVSKIVTLVKVGADFGNTDISIF